LQSISETIDSPEKNSGNGSKTASVPGGAPPSKFISVPVPKRTDLAHVKSALSTMIANNAPSAVAAPKTDVTGQGAKNQVNLTIYLPNGQPMAMTALDTEIFESLIKRALALHESQGVVS
jgi:hypothetical protein